MEPRNHIVYCYSGLHRNAVISELTKFIVASIAIIELSHFIIINWTKEMESHNYIVHGYQGSHWNKYNTFGEFFIRRKTLVTAHFFMCTLSMWCMYISAGWVNDMYVGILGVNLPEKFNHWVAGLCYQRRDNGPFGSSKSPEGFGTRWNYFNFNILNYNLCNMRHW